MLRAIPVEIRQLLMDELSRLFDGPVELRYFQMSSGGCINHGGRIDTSAGSFFLKWNEAGKYPAMLFAEQRGLELLRKANALRIPQVVVCDSAGNYQVMVMEHIETGMKSPTYWQELGKGLALVHKENLPLFGLDHDNYIGSLHQTNDRKRDWCDFFIENRLTVQVELARNNGLLAQLEVRHFDLLYKALPNLLPKEVPSLLHGDLWSGNVMCDSRGMPVLIDPAVYYGHREVDLAMTKLFGGFDDSFYKSYSEIFPLEKGFEERIDLYNLYPLLVHLNLFGRGYHSAVLSVLNRFT